MYQSTYLSVICQHIVLQMKVCVHKTLQLMTVQQHAEYWAFFWLHTVCLLTFYKSFWSHAGSVSIVTCYGLGDWGSIFDKGKGFFFQLCV